MNHAVRRLGVLSLAVSVLGVAQAAPHLPAFTAVDITPPNGSTCQTYGLNASGQVAGVIFADPSYQSGRGFVTGPQGTGVTLVGTVGGGDVSALVAVDDAGNAAGFASTAPGGWPQTTIVVRAGSGTPIDVGSPTTTFSDPNAMSDRDVVVGVAGLPDGTMSGYTIDRKSHGPMQLMGVNVFPNDITRDGRIVGVVWAPDYSGSTAFITGPKGQGMTMLGSLGGTSTVAQGVNRHGVVVGTSQLADGATTHGFVTDAGGGNLRDLGIPGLLVSPSRINAHGQIVGYFVPSSWSDPSHPFLAFPDGHWWDLSGVSLGDGRTVASVTGINDAGQVAAMSNDHRCFLLTPQAR
jgi:probable HAF family extracellular repeat protein